MSLAKPTLPVVLGLAERGSPLASSNGGRWLSICGVAQSHIRRTHRPGNLAQANRKLSSSTPPPCRSDFCKVHRPQTNTPLRVHAQPVSRRHSPPRRAVFQINGRNSSNSLFPTIIPHSSQTRALTLVPPPRCPSQTCSPSSSLLSHSATSCQIRPIIPRCCFVHSCWAQRRLRRRKGRFALYVLRDF